MSLPKEDIEQWVSDIQGSAKSIGETLTDPDDDWSPALFAIRSLTDEEQAEVDRDHDDDIDGEKPKFAVLMVMIDDRAMSSDEHKDKLAEVMEQMISQHNAEAAAFVSSTWYVRPPREGENWPKEMIERAMDVPPSEHPWRSEGLHLMVVTPDEDAMYVAEIHRDAYRVPWLQEWEKLPVSNEKGGGLAGRFYEALRKGIGKERPKATAITEMKYAAARMGFKVDGQTGEAK